MPKQWLAIKQARPDVTDYLIHWTRGQKVDNQRLSAFQMLKHILGCGFLKPPFAPKPRTTGGGVENTIKGQYPAVCFTEQPLDAFAKSVKALSSRYKPYGIAVRKEQLFIYGGRPVIYGDEALLATLPEQYKYLWARFNPIPNYQLGGYPVDWTHEREWRARAHPYSYGQFGESPADGVPLLLPIDLEAPEPALWLPWIMVKNNAEVEELKEWFDGLEPYVGSSGVLEKYFEVLPKVPILPLDEVRTRLDQGDARWARLDTLPYEEFYPEGVEGLTRLGWRKLQQN